jgi:hypothetical protein
MTGDDYPCCERCVERWCKLLEEIRALQAEHAELRVQIALLKQLDVMLGRTRPESTPLQ